MNERAERNERFASEFRTEIKTDIKELTASLKEDIRTMGNDMRAQIECQDGEITELKLARARMEGAMDLGWKILSLMGIGGLITAGTALARTFNK